MGDTNGIRANLCEHRRVRVRGKDIGHMEHVGSVWHMAWNMCRHWTHDHMRKEGMFLVNVCLVVGVPGRRGC
jgi:hypothetical protein